MSDWQKDLVDEVIKWLAKSKSSTRAALLEHLFTCQMGERSDKALAAKFYRDRSRGVGTEIRRLKADLRQYFRGEGKDNLSCLQIGAKRCLTFAHNPKTSDTVNSVWACYPSGSKTLLLYTEPLFFHCRLNILSADGTVVTEEVFLRCLRTNAGNTPPTEFHELGIWKPCFNYVAAGEVQCVNSLTVSFRDRYADVYTGVSHRFYHPRASTREQELRKYDGLLFVGSSRTNWAVKHYQMHPAFDITVQEDHIAIKNPLPGEKEAYTDLEDEKGGCRLIYALLSRRPSLIKNGQWITIISSNHALAYEAVAAYLTLDPLAGTLLRLLSEDNTHELPECFQVLFAVRVNPIDETPIDDYAEIRDQIRKGRKLESTTDIVAWRPYSSVDEKP